ncbi:MAG: energy-coupling factor ABC transporter ATP-binding protein [Oscillospiraceae bacterium]|nr:energy-coupling factor ABC transporter ATP-binding protein [Oscillospiraceae bacterium]
MPIELESVSFAYKSADGSEIQALRDISIKIGDGEFVGIMGHTGCGKTTLIQLMAGLLTPVSGSVLFDGLDINMRDYDRAKLREAVSLVFQFPEYQLFESTVERDVAFGLKHSRQSRDEISERVRWSLEIMGFDFDLIRKKSPLSLSGGEKRRVAIAGALVTKPRYLIFDEPIAGLDQMSRNAFLEIIDELNREGTAVVMVSHNADAISEYCKRVIIFSDGELVTDGAVKEVFSDINKLEELYLNAGTPRTIGHMLSGHGMEISDKATSYDELLFAIKSKLQNVERTLH